MARPRRPAVGLVAWSVLRAWSVLLACGALLAAAAPASARGRVGAPWRVYPFTPDPLLRAPTPADGLRPFWDDGLPCSVGCRPPGAIDGWPLKPFHRQHALRGALNEIRSSSLHHAIDIQANDNVPVYAIQPGSVSIIQSSGPEERLQVGNFIYWHVRIVVSPGQAVTPYRTVLGYTLPGFGHLALAEVDAGGRYLNPLRPGGRVVSPWSDSAAPVIGQPLIAANGSASVRAFDPQSFRIRTHYVTPVLSAAALAYRVFDAAGAPVGPLRWAYDGSQNLDYSLRNTIFMPDATGAAFLCFTNDLICRPNWDYRLAGGLAPRIGGLADGDYRLTVYAWNWAGVASARDQPFGVRRGVIAEGAAPVLHPATRGRGRYLPAPAPRPVKPAPPRAEARGSGRVSAATLPRRRSVALAADVLMHLRGQLAQALGQRVNLHRQVGVLLQEVVGRL